VGIEEKKNSGLLIKSGRRTFLKKKEWLAQRNINACQKDAVSEWSVVKKKKNKG
jgi:hypothetical protein